MDSLIYDIQEEIKNSNPHWKYNDYYRMVELQYWSEIPQMIREFNNNYPIKTCLDIGCAMGTLLLYTHKLSNCKLAGLEIEKHLSDNIIKKYSVDYKVLNFELEEHNYNETFDCIIMTEIFEHFKFNPVGTMKKVKKLLSPNGRLYLSTPNVEVWGKIDKYNTWKEMPTPEGYQYLPDLGHEYQYSINEIIEIIQLAGMRINKIDYSPKNTIKQFNLEIIKE
jgi:2-polyprenyl-3-methyl-5-hydroxy-6-metoxy-1,4-benzoquinol methylase